MQDASEKTSIWKVIGASSAGTLIEWYDFYIFGSLTVTLSAAFFPKTNPVAALLSTLALFATGFLVRPFGAVFFGRLGDMVGRKHTFLVTLLLMGGSTFAIGLLPTYKSVGLLAPFLLLILRLLQGLAMGGEYGGAATYVAEHAPDGRRGYYTSFIQTTATLGLFVSLAVIMLVNNSVSKPDFDDWGWRIPFLLSIILVIFSYLIRRKMDESPMFTRLQSAGQVSKNPLKESFGNAANRNLVLLVLFGLTAGQGVVWYTGQFYALLYLQTVLNIAKNNANIIIAVTLLIGTPLFIVFGSLSDRIGRKKIILTGCVLAAALYVPLYMGMVHITNVKGFTATSAPVVKAETKPDPETHGTLTVTTTTTQYEEAKVTETLTEHSAPASGAAPAKPEKKTEVVPGTSIMVSLGFFILIQLVFVTMVYGPIAAFLVELFPTRIRYTSMSVPYHLGNGVFGGLVPIIATAMQKGTGNLYAGLAFPIVVALMTATIGGFFIHEKRDVRLWSAEPDALPSD
jgi:MFS family permease